MGWFMRSDLKKLPVINISDIDVESLASGSLMPKRIRFAMAHPDKCCTATFHSLAEIDAYCSNKVLTAKRKDFYGGDPQGISELFLIHLDWVLNTGFHKVEYESRKGPYLVLRGAKTPSQIYDSSQGRYPIFYPKELVVRTGQSIWQVYSFYAEGLLDIEEDPVPDTL